MCHRSTAIVESLRDGRGLAISSSNADARDCCDAALLRLHGGCGDVDDHVARALRHDADCVIAHCLRAWTLLLASERPYDQAAAAVIRTLERLDGRANDRERRHAAAACAWYEGDLHRALACVDGLLIDYPRDSLALQLAHALDFRLGHREMLRDRVAQVLPHWHAGIPGYGHVLAMYAFGLEEAGDYRSAESIARESLQLIPDNAAAIHVIAHVLEMQGRTLEGIDWLESTRGRWATNAAFGLHIAWHLALLHIDNDDAAAAVAIYDRTFEPTHASSIPALVDASALLWRLELRGVPLHARWRGLARCWIRKPLRGSRTFNLVHAVVAFASARRWRLASRAVAALRDDPAMRSTNAHDDLALATRFCEALQAFARGAYATAADKISEIRAITARCGGSIAQCDLIHLTFIEAALRSRRSRLAQALAAERTARKPGSLLNRWLFARARAMA